MSKVQNPVTKVPPLKQSQNLDLRELMEEANHASGVSKDTTPIRIDVEWLH